MNPIWALEEWNEEVDRLEIQRYGRVRTSGEDLRYWAYVHSETPAQFVERLCRTLLSYDSYEAK